MVIIGLTGSIAMGKSTAARMLRAMGLPVHDADAAVRRLQGPGGRALPAIEALFPGTVKNGVLDRQAVGARVFGDREALARLEAAIHPLVQAQTQDFLKRCCRLGVPAVVLDIPLLFEGGGDARTDFDLVVSAPAFIQRRRVLSRPGMDAAKLAGILARQMPDREKRRMADAVIPTGLGRAVTLRHLERAVTLALDRANHPPAWPPNPHRIAMERRNARNRARHRNHRL